MTIGGAADRAGFQIDDRIISINGITLSDLLHSDIVQLISEADSTLEVKIERIPEGQETEIEAKIKYGSLERNHNDDFHPTTSLDLDLPVMSAEPRPASRLFQHPPLAESESSATTPPCLSPPEIKMPVPDIISLVLKRDQVGSAGFSIMGSGSPADPIRISELALNGPAQQSGKLAVGDRIRSVNGVDVRNASREKVVSFLKSTSDIYLVVERESQVRKPNSLNHARSLPSLVAIDQSELEPFSAPPLPPRRSSSRDALFADLSKFDFSAMLKDRVNISKKI